jgi:hypothetical protein
MAPQPAPDPGEGVGEGGPELTYQAAVRTGRGREPSRSWASSATSEYSASKAGVVRAMALSV